MKVGKALIAASLLWTAGLTECPAATAARVQPMAPASGVDVLERFRSGLADARCASGTSKRWQRHYSDAADRLAKRDGQTLPVFAHVVDALRTARLPTEYALIPFVESGYRPHALNPTGPAGLWQFVAPTARRLRVPMGAEGDGRLSPVESTRAAVEYLKMLHQRFGGNWRLAAMAYNAGEHRVSQALRRQGRAPAAADLQALKGVPASTRAYIDKLDALACVVDEAATRPEWRRALERPVRPIYPLQRPVKLPRPTIPARS